MNHATSRRTFARNVALSPLALGSAVASAAGEPAAPRPARCAIGKVIVTDTYGETKPFGKDLEARLLYLENGPIRWLLAAFDFSYLRRGTTQAWREAVAQATGIPREAIWVHATHNHAGADAPQVTDDVLRTLVDRCVPEIQAMIGRAEEAELAYAVADTEGRYNLRREQYVPGLGTVTMWHGWEYDDDGRPWAQDPKWMLLRGWTPQLPAFDHKIHFDRPVDASAHLVVFRSLRDQRVIGHLVRFTGHPVIFNAPQYVGHPEEMRQHPDWPGCLREAIEAELGGTGVAVNGPCGDVCIRHDTHATYAGAERECREISGGIARECIAAFRRDPACWQPVVLDAPQCERVELPLRDSLPRSHDGLAAHCQRGAAAAEEALREALGRAAPAFEIKQHVDLVQHWKVMPRFCVAWCDITEAELERHQLEQDLWAVRINDLVLTGWAGETMTDTSLWLQAQSIGRRLLTIDELNGYTVYNTTREQFREGGYSFWCSLWSPDAEPLLRRRALELIERVAARPCP